MQSRKREIDGVQRENRERERDLLLDITTVTYYKKHKGRLTQKRFKEICVGIRSGVN